jgi:ketosteroid isomerase-like protein
MTDHADTLEGLLDKSRIADVIHAYCLHFDRAEAEAVADLFTDDAVVDYGPEFPAMTGREVILSAVASGLATRFLATSHHVSNIMITFDGPDRASSIAYVYAWHRYRDGSRDGELWAQYHHDFRRTADGWKIARLVLKAAGTDGFHRASMHPIGRRGG